MFMDDGWQKFGPFLGHPLPPSRQPQAEHDGSSGRASEDLWVVLLEFAAGPGQSPFRLDDVVSVVEGMARWDATGLYSPQRYSVQIHVEATDPLTAARLARGAHDGVALAVLGRPARLVRTDVVERAEMERGWDSGPEVEPADLDRLSSAVIPREVYRATRALLAATTPAEVMAGLVGFVTAAGGTVQVGSAPPPPNHIRVDLGVARGEALSATAEALSVAGMIFERFLPALVRDAQTAANRLTARTTPDRARRPASGDAPA